MDSGFGTIGCVGDRRVGGGRSGDVPDIELHSLVGAVGLTFAGSFIGAFIKRAFDS